MKLKGKTALITGGGSGIGRATASLFAREGAHVVCVDINSDRGLETVSMIKEWDKEALFIEADVSASNQVLSMAKKCKESLSQLDILFNNAGEAIWESFEMTTERTWLKMLETNLSSIFFCSINLLPLMRKCKRGTIINHASIDAIMGNPHLAAYSAAKGGIIPLTHVMAYDLAKYNIRVNCLCTGGIPTAINSGVAGLMDRLVSATPAGRLGVVEEVASTVLFLASDDSSYVNGATIVVDGGRTTITPGTA
jgi:NAD(P)-dependent dehydrogenase (short-subunit alcohol dehydrogenase family)